jgi:hypothetical protein
MTWTVPFLRRARISLTFLTVCAAPASLLAFDLSTIKSEPNPEHRSELALTNANSALDTARSAYDSGDAAKAEAALDEVLESVDLAYDSLSSTGKDPRRSPKYFKKAEMSIRLLLRRIEGVAQNFSFADRTKIEHIRDHVSEIHDNLIEGIMSKKKK